MDTKPTTTVATTTAESRDLVAQVVHDLAGPISVLHTCLRVLGKQLHLEESSPAFQAYATAGQAVERLRALRESLHRPPVTSERADEVCDVAAVLREQCAAARAAAGDRDVTVVYTGPERCAATVDRARFDRVIQNLLMNAVQAMTAPHGFLWLHAAISDDGELAIDILDNGCGIPPAHLDKIFAKGFTHGKADGTGLGLDFCKQTIESLGGRLTVTSRQGDGTCFHLRLPRVVMCWSREAAVDDGEAPVRGGDLPCERVEGETVEASYQFTAETAWATQTVMPERPLLWLDAAAPRWTHVSVELERADQLS